MVGSNSSSTYQLHYNNYYSSPFKHSFVMVPAA